MVEELGGCQAAVPMVEPDRVRSGNARLFLESSLCLYRACLGRMFLFIYKWLKKTPFNFLRQPFVDKKRALVKTGSGPNISKR